MQGEVGRHAGLGGPSDHTAREQIDNDTQVKSALMGLDVGDVGDPDLIRCRRLELLFQLVLSDDGWLAAITARTTPVANLCDDPGQRCQPRHPVLGNLFSLIAQIVRQLAIAIDLAAVGPGLTDQFGRAQIFLRTLV